MYSIQTYTNTKCELYIANARLRLLMDKKEELYCRYFGITSTLKEVVVSSSQSNDKMADYVIALNEVDPITGTSLDQEIHTQERKVYVLSRYLLEMENAIKTLSGIEVDLFKEIVFNGTKITKAVEKIAEKYGKDDRTVWRIYHNNIKEYVKKLIIYGKK